MTTENARTKLLLDWVTPSGEMLRAGTPVVFRDWVAPNQCEVETDDGRILLVDATHIDSHAFPAPCRHSGQVAL